ncbi:Fis family transcriptional regulator [Erysipelothrix larvae]|uniref:Ribosome hibernation promoting factor n=1 Tax=Erysipelothrix larvae TaxID=1514105 RepID=A0A0X8GYZ3_9FIRM|nr:ribosome-associated translation inhibitor RaiA [Erysipelothrix larvae]AMC93006.1 Fis family transcriptional regulator [Erysipelothrix larvae]
MLVYIHGKNVDITDAMHQRVEDKLKFMEKYFDLDDSYRANVVVSVYPDGQKVEVTITTKIGLLRAEVKHDDFYAALDLSVDKLEDQIRRHKTKLSRKNKESLAQSFLNLIEESENEDEPKLVRTKTIVAESMELNDAILNMELLGHSFFIYTDEETEDIAVVYKRKDGDYGLLEVERE